MQTHDRPRTVRIRARGQLTIPRELRDQMDFNRDANVSVMRIGKTLVMTPAPSKRVALARQFEAEMKSEGLTLDELLANLRSQRENFTDEAYSADR